MALLAKTVPTDARHTTHCSLVCGSSMQRYSNGNGVVTAFRVGWNSEWSHAKWAISLYTDAVIESISLHRDHRTHVRLSSTNCFFASLMASRASSNRSITCPLENSWCDKYVRMLTMSRGGREANSCCDSALMMLSPLSEKSPNPVCTKYMRNTSDAVCLADSRMSGNITEADKKVQDGKNQWEHQRETNGSRDHPRTPILSVVS